MKKILLITLLCFLFCVNDSNFFELQAQDTQTVYIDTTIEISFVMNRTARVTAAGVEMLFDSTQIKFIDKEVFGHFSHEAINLVNDLQGHLMFGFSDTNPVTLVKNDTLFTLQFYVKIDNPGECYIRFQNPYIELSGNEVENKFHELQFMIKQIFEGELLLR